MEYKNWLTANKYILKDEPIIWSLYIFKAQPNEQKYEYMISFSIDKASNNIFKGYFKLEEDIVFVNSKIEDTVVYKHLNISYINDSVLIKANKKFTKTGEFLFDPSFRIIIFKKGIIKIKDYDSFGSLPKRYRFDNIDELKK